MTTTIHPTSIVDPKAELGEGVVIGPMCHIGPQVVLKDNVKLIAQVSILGRTEVGEDCIVHPFAALGSPPQDFKYRGGDVSLVIGPRNVIREHTTMHLGTEAGRGETRVGADGYFMVGSHIAHDCIVGNKVMFANGGTIAGGVEMGDYVIMGAISAVHQNRRVGRHAFIAAGAFVTQEVIPYGMVDKAANLNGLNLVGLKRRGFSRDRIHEMRAAYRMMFSSEGNFVERVEDASRLFGECPEVVEIIDFIRSSGGRPLCGPEL